MVASRALVFRPLVEGNEDFGNEIVSESKVLRQEKHTHVGLVVLAGPLQAMISQKKISQAKCKVYFHTYFN